MRRGLRRLLVITALACSAATVAVGSPQTVTTSPPVAATSSTPTAQKRSEHGVWRHFGEGGVTPPAAPSQTGEWRHFGNQATPPAAPRGSLQTRHNPGQTRTRNLEEQMYELVNRDRADPANHAETHGQALPLRWNEQLAAVARAHSLDMLNNRYFGHQDPEGRTVATRVEAAGMAWQSVGENLALSASVTRAEAAFMNEPRFTQNHRANILNSTFTEIGIGIVQAPDGSLYITQDFLTPSPQSEGH